MKLRFIVATVSIVVACLLAVPNAQAEDQNANDYYYQEVYKDLGGRVDATQ